MKLRFQVDQAEMFRKGIDCPKSIITVEVDPAKVDPAIRELIAQRMNGIDVYHLDFEVLGADEPYIEKQRLIVADGVTLNDLIDAVKKDDVRLKRDVEQSALELEDARLTAATKGNTYRVLKP